jgi:hypothetical protein
MLKLKITQAQFDALDEATKALYKASGAEHVLNVEPDPQVATLTAEVTKLTGDIDARKDFIDPSNVPDIAAVNKQLADEKLANEANVSKYQSMISKNMIAERGRTIAAEIFKSPSVTKRFVEDRLTVDFASGEPVLKVLGEDGKPSETSFEDLSKSMRENAEYSDIVIGTKANGGAGQKTPGHVPSPRKADDEKNVDFSRASSQSLVDRVKEKRAAQEEAQ